MRPWVRKRSRQWPTVWRLTRTLSATAELSRPSTHSSTILARHTRPAGRLRDRASASSSSRVSRLTSSGFKGRPRAMVSPSLEWIGRTIPCLRHYVHILKGRNTRGFRYCPSGFSPSCCTVPTKWTGGREPQGTSPICPRKPVGFRLWPIQAMGQVPRPGTNRVCQGRERTTEATNRRQLNYQG